MLIPLLAILVQNPPQAPPPSVTIPRIDTVITVDGRLDEPVWAKAARLEGFHQYRPVDGRPAEQETILLVWYSPTAIHIGVIGNDTDPGSIRATFTDRDKIDGEDRVRIYLDTFNDRRRAAFFGVNGLGIQEDGIRSETGTNAGSLFGGQDDLNVDFIWDSKGQLTDHGYQVEIRIPFKSLQYGGSGPQTWGFNATRYVKRSGFEDTWTDVRRANSSFLAQVGTITGLENLQRGVVFEAQPFVTASWNGSQDATGTFTREDPVPERRGQPAGRDDQHGVRRHGEPRFQPDRVRRRLDHRQRTVCPLPAGKTALLSQGHRPLHHAGAADLHPADRQPDRWRETHRQAGPATASPTSVRWTNSRTRTRSSTCCGCAATSAPTAWRASPTPTGSRDRHTTESSRATRTSSSPPCTSSRRSTASRGPTSMTAWGRSATPSGS